MARASSDRGRKGVEVRHQRGCGASSGAACTCRPSYRASVWDPRDRRLIRRTFPTAAAAKGWRVDALGALRRGELRGELGPTLRAAAEAWEAGARAGAIRNRSGDRYKPSVIRGYETSMRLRLLPQLGGVRMAELRRADAQRLVDELLRGGHEPSTIRNTLLPLRAICRRALAARRHRGEPDDGAASCRRCAGVATGSRRRPRPRSLLVGSSAIARCGRRRSTPGCAAASCRRCAGRTSTSRGADPRPALLGQQDGPIGPKSEPAAGVVPIAAHPARRAGPASRGVRLAGGTRLRPRRGEGVRARNAPSGSPSLGRRELAPIGLHECRHTFASFMIAAGVNAKALSTTWGTRRHDHVRPLRAPDARQRGRGARLLDDYLTASTARDAA